MSMHGEAVAFTAVRDTRALIVDWDETYAFSRGTKDNPGPKIAHHQRVAKLCYGYDLSVETIDEYWGQGLEVELPAFYGHPDLPFERLLEDYNYFTRQFPKPLLPGARELHDAAGEAGLLRGVVTTLLTDNARREIEIAGIDPEDFTFIHGKDAVPERKPSIRAFEPALQILAEHSIQPEQAMYIGDTLDDGHSSAGAGLYFMGVATGRVALSEFNAAGYPAGESLAKIGRLVLPNFFPVSS